MARIIRVLCTVVLLPGLLLGCSTLRLGYEQLPTLAYWWLDRHLDFDDAQASQVREALAHWHAEHRREEVPALQHLLQQAQALVLSDFSAEQACQISDALRQRLRAAAALAEVPSARIALGFGPAQLAALKEQQAQSNAKFQKEWLDISPEQQKNRRYQAQRKRYEDFYGRLNESQRQQLQNALAATQYDVQLLDAERKRRQSALLALLQEWQHTPTTEEDAQRALHAYLNDVHQAPAGPWRAQQQALWQQGCEVIAALHATTHAEQRAQAHRRLQGYAQDLEALRQR